MARDLWEVKSKTSTLTGILCNIEDKEEGVKGGENSDNKNHMVALSHFIFFTLASPSTPCPTSSVSILAAASPASPIKR